MIICEDNQKNVYSSLMMMLMMLMTLTIMMMTTMMATMMMTMMMMRSPGERLLQLSLGLLQLLPQPLILLLSSRSSLK